MEEDPILAPPVDELEPLACGEGQLFTKSQLVEFLDDTSFDPAPPSPKSPEADQARGQLHIASWAKQMEARGPQEEVVLGSFQRTRKSSRRGASKFSFHP